MASTTTVSLNRVERLRRCLLEFLDGKSSGSTGSLPAAKENDNSATEKRMRQFLSDEFTGVSWIDLCHMSAVDKNDAINQWAIEKSLADPRVLDAYHDRFMIQMSASDTIPVVYVAGKTCQKPFDMMKDRNMVTPVTDRSVPSASARLYTSRDKVFLAAEDRPHPSYHLVKGGESQSTASFRETMHVLNALQDVKMMDDPKHRIAQPSKRR